jgi:excisionase family DNA binding protein
MMPEPTTTYQRGWDRAFAIVDAQRALDRARIPAAAPELLTYGEAADRLKVDPRTVRNLIERGELTRVTIPATNARRLAAADVAALIERGVGS